MWEWGCGLIVPIISSWIVKWPLLLIAAAFTSYSGTQDPLSIFGLVGIMIGYDAIRTFIF